MSYKEESFLANKEKALNISVRTPNKELSVGVYKALRGAKFDPVAL